MFVQHIFRSVTYLLLLNKLVILLSVSLYVRNVVFLSFCNEKVSVIVFHMACPVTLAVSASHCLIERVLLLYYARHFTIRHRSLHIVYLHPVISYH